MLHSITLKTYFMSHLIGPDGVAKGEDALTILETPQLRSQFIDELMEVRNTAKIQFFILKESNVERNIICDIAS